MSAKPETTFIASVHRHLPPSLYRMKNHNEYVSGVPDVWYSGGRADLWVEYKFFVAPVRDTTMISLTEGKTPMLSALQQAWLEARNAEGRNVGVILGSKDGGVWLPGTSWQFPLSAATYRSWLQKRPALAQTILDFVGHPP